MAATTGLLLLHLQLAANITKIMDTRIDPCVDFYSFACGNYNDSVVLPEDKSSVHRFQETDDQVKVELRSLFEQPDGPGDPASTRIVKQFYRSCTNVPKLEELGMEPLRSLLDNYGGWPVVEGGTWKESDYDWMKMSAHLAATLGHSDILTVGIGTDFKNSSKRTLTIDQANLGLQKREFYLENGHKKVLAAYFDFMVATAIQLGAPAAVAKKELQEALDFEIELANISVRAEDRRDNNALYRPITIGDLRKEHPKVNFDVWLKTVAEAGLILTDSDVINLSGKPYLEKLPAVLSKHSARTLANFQIGRMAMGYISALAPSLRENYRKFNQALTGTPKFLQRWEECVEVTTALLKMPVGAAYVKEHFSQGSKAELDQMVLGIREAMKSTIDNIDWMDSRTKTTHRGNWKKCCRISLSHRLIFITRLGSCEITKKRSCPTILIWRTRSPSSYQLLRGRFVNFGIQ